MRYAAPVRFQQQQSAKLGIFADITNVSRLKKDDEADPKGLVSFLYRVS